MNKNLFLGFILIILTILSSSSELINREFFTSEFGIIEVLQALILILTINNLWNNRKLFKRYFPKLFFLKITLFSIVLYEELSFITKYLGLNRITEFNYKSEFNLHNAYFWRISFLSDSPFFDDISLTTIIFNIIILLLVFGAYFPFLSKIKFLFLEKKVSFFALILPFNLIFSAMFLKFNLIQRNYIIFDECVELFLYLLFFFDNLEKIKIHKL